ncbi:LysR family transcriptional regulator [Acidovorax sp.]|uniref:LysR family transcriptional regulator n=1 Tax=Acidovorax sp. TaxID=1872122 RepID=UPI003A1005EC
MTKDAVFEPPVSRSAGGALGNRLQLMETFVRIVEAGSLSAAAAQMHATQPTVSRRLQALEQSLGLRLLQRTTHTMRLTVDGERCYQRAKELLASWASFEADLRGAQEEPEGTLRVAMPHAFGQEMFVGPLAQFLHVHPRVSVEWLLRDDVRDFIGSGIDCAIQVGEPADPAVVAIRLAEVPRIVVGAPSLLGPGGTVPTDPDGLAALPWLALHTYYRSELALTHATTGETRRIAFRPRVSTDSLYALRSAAKLGLGACAGSAWLMQQELVQGALVQLAPQWQPAPLPMFLIYPHARFYPSRLLRFVSAMREAVPAMIVPPQTH